MDVRTSWQDDLHTPWPDFLTFYGTTATAAGLVVPKHYLQQVGEEGFKKHPIGLGPYQFIRHTPGSSWCWKPPKATGAMSRTSNG